MNEVNTVNSSANLTPRASISLYTPKDAPAGVRRDGDSVEFSETAALLAKLTEMPDTRDDLIHSIRHRIDDNTYLSDEKLDQALEALFDDFQF